MDEAKMTGMTPPVFTFSGMCVLDPPYIRRPTTRFAYCTVTRRWPRSIEDDRGDDEGHQDDQDQHLDEARAARAASCSTVDSTACGKLTTIPA